MAFRAKIQGFANRYGRGQPDWEWLAEGPLMGALLIDGLKALVQATVGIPGQTPPAVQAPKLIVVRIWHDEESLNLHSVRVELTRVPQVGIPPERENGHVV